MELANQNAPNNAIYEGAVDWKASDGTSLKGTVTLKSGLTMDANAPQRPVSDDVYYIVPDKCTRCKGFPKNHNAQRFVR